MSNCSCGGSCGCGTGPEMRIDNLPKGEQVVTTVKREDIPKPPPKPTFPGTIVFLLAVYIGLLLVWALRGGIQYPPVDDVSPYPPSDPYPQPCSPPQDPYCLSTTD